MVRFEDKKLVIEIDSPRPVETWMNIHKGICDMARNVSQENIINDSFYCVIDFLSEIMPDYVDAKEMTNPTQNSIQ